MNLLWVHKQQKKAYLRLFMHINLYSFSAGSIFSECKVVLTTLRADTDKLIVYIYTHINMAVKDCDNGGSLSSYQIFHSIFANDMAFPVLCLFSF